MSLKRKKRKRLDRDRNSVPLNKENYKRLYEKLEKYNQFDYYERECELLTKYVVKRHYYYKNIFKLISFLFVVRIFLVFSFKC